MGREICALLLIGISLISNLAVVICSPEPKWVESCPTSTFRVLSKTRLENGHVYKKQRLGPGQGTRECLSVCKGEENCWSFNFEVNRKQCYLMDSTDDEVSRKRKGGWTSGYRECVESTTGWGNENIAFPSTKGFTATATVSCTRVQISWPVPPVNTTGYDISCTIVGGSSTTASTTDLFYSISGLSTNTAGTCTVTAVTPSSGTTYSDSVSFLTLSNSACGPADTSSATFDSTVTVTVNSCDQATIDAITTAVCDQQKSFLISQGFLASQITCTATASCPTRRRSLLASVDIPVAVSLAIDIETSQDATKYESTKAAILNSIQDKPAYTNLPSGVTIKTVGSASTNKVASITITSVAQVTGQYFQRQVSWTVNDVVVEGMAASSFTVKCFSDSDSSALRTITTANANTFTATIGSAASGNNAALKGKVDYKCAVAANNAASSGAFVVGSQISTTPPYATVDTVVGPRTGSSSCTSSVDAVGGTTGTDARVNYPYYVALSGTSLYIAEFNGHKIRKFDTVTNKVTTVIGTGTSASSADGQASGTTRVSNPTGIAVQGSDIYFTEYTAGKIRKLNGTNYLSTIATGLSNPFNLAVDGRYLYVAGWGANKVFRYDLENNNQQNVTAGTGSSLTYNSNQEGQAATTVSVKEPYDVALYNGNLFIAEFGNCMVRRVNLTTGKIYRAAGNGTCDTYNQAQHEGADATSVPLGRVLGVHVDSNGNLYISDFFAYRLRYVSSNGKMYLLGGTGVSTFSNDPTTPAQLSTFYQPAGMAMYSNGNLYAAERGSCRIRKLTFS